jgi:Uncharacterized protein family, UPF0114
VIEAIIVNSRWLVAPFLLGLIVGLAALIYKFLLKLVEFITELHAAVPREVIVGILNLVDLTLVADLIVIVVCSSYENFLAPIDAAKHPDAPAGLIRIGRTSSWEIRPQNQSYIYRRKLPWRASAWVLVREETLNQNCGREDWKARIYSSSASYR